MNISSLLKFLFVGTVLLLVNNGSLLTQDKSCNEMWTAGHFLNIGFNIN